MRGLERIEWRVGGSKTEEFVQIICMAMVVGA